MKNKARRIEYPKFPGAGIGSTNGSLSRAADVARTAERPLAGGGATYAAEEGATPYKGAWARWCPRNWEIKRSDGAAGIAYVPPKGELRKSHDSAWGLACMQSSPRKAEEGRTLHPCSGQKQLAS